MQSISDKVIGRFSRYRTMLNERAAGGPSPPVLPRDRRGHAALGLPGAARPHGHRHPRAAQPRLRGPRPAPGPGPGPEPDPHPRRGRVRGGQPGPRADRHPGVHAGPICASRCAFDSDKGKCNRVYSGVKCHSLDLLDQVVAQEDITLAILCVPAAAAQAVAERAGPRRGQRRAQFFLHRPAAAQDHRPGRDRHRQLIWQS